MIKNIPFFLIVLIIILFRSGAAALAEGLLDVAPSVPLAVSPAEYERLFQQKVELDSRRQDIESAVAELNKECSHVSNQDPDKVSSCAKEQGELYDRMDAYEAALQTYHLNIQAPPRDGTKDEQGLNRDNYSTSGFWLDWLEDIRREEKVSKALVKDFERRTDNALEDLSAGYDDWQTARKKNDAEAQAYASELIHKAYKALNDIEKEENEILKPNTLAVVATAAMQVHRYDEAVEYFKKAVDAQKNSSKKERLRKALGLAMYKRDQVKGAMKDDPKTVILLNALQSGESSYDRSVRFLNDGIKSVADDAQKQNYRDVLNYVEGLRTYAQFLDRQKLREEKMELMQLPVPTPPTRPK